MEMEEKVDGETGGTRGQVPCPTNNLGGTRNLSPRPTRLPLLP